MVLALALAVAVAFCLGLWAYTQKQQEALSARASQAVAQMTSLTQELGGLRREVARLRQLNEEQGLRLKRLARGAGADVSQAHRVIRRAAEEYQAGRHYNAREQARMALEILPRHEEAYVLLGSAACKLKDRKEAQRAVDHLPSPRRKEVQRICEESGVALSPPRSPQPRPTQRELNAAFAAIGPDIKRCVRQHGATGLVHVRFAFVQQGTVQTAEVPGKLAGTVTGKCVVKAARKVRVKPFSGPSLSITYPFVLQ